MPPLPSAGSTGQTCGRCGRATAENDLSCPLCGNLLQTMAPPRRRGAAARPAPNVRSLRAAQAATSVTSRPEPLHEHDDARVLGVPEPWFYLLLGLVTAPLFSVTPLVRLIGWFLSALVHEMGHSVVAWTFGLPAFPAISLTAEAAAVHGEQVVLLVVLIWAGLTYGAWRVPHRALRYVALPLAAVVYPALAFTEGHQPLFLVAGHLGELAFGALCLRRTLSGGFTESAVERGLYGTVGWYLVGNNLVLTAGLVASAARRAHYASNGSFGITNDYLRLAEDVLGWPLEAVAAGMCLVALATPVAALAWWRFGRDDG